MEVSKPSKRPPTRRSFYCVKNTTPSLSIRECVNREAPVYAELSINFDVQEEVVDKLFRCISRLYEKEETSVVLSITKATHLRLGGSLEPAYVLTITTLPEQLQPTLNKRSAYTIQRSLASLVDVSSDRGLIKFVSVQEEMFATGGTTILGKITAKTELERRRSPSVERSGGNRVSKLNFLNKLLQ